MRRSHWFLMLSLVIAYASTVRADDPRLWDTTGVVIRQGYQIEWQRNAEMDENGNVIYAWSDTRSGDRDVFAQKVSPTGQKLWPEDGAVIVSELGRQEDPQLIPTGLGDYIFIWNDFRTDAAKGDLYAQKVSADGDLIWAAGGVLLSEGDFDSPAEFRIVADGTGGAMIMWNDLRNGDVGDIYATRVLANGTIPAVWGANGLPVSVAPEGQRQITMDTDGAGGAIIAWSDSRFSPTSGKDIYIQRVTQNGQLAWGSDGVVVCDTILDQESPKICPNGSGGAFIVWVDKRSDSNGDLYYQIVSNTGGLVLPSPQGRPLIALNLQQEKPRIVNDGSGNAIIVWLDTRNDPGQNLFYDIYAQKINSSGTKQWAADGVPVCVQSSDQTEARINADDAGGAICVWMDERNGNESPKTNIYAQKINSNGSMAWTTNGIPVCLAAGYQNLPLVRAASTYSMMVWGDERSGSRGIWHQLLNASGAPQLAADGDTLIWGISGDAVSPVLIPDGLSKTLVFYQDLREGSAGYMAYVQVLDTTGHTYLETNGRPICPEPVYTSIKTQQWLTACTDGSNGAIAVWQDSRDSNPYKQVYAQRVTSGGALLWGGAGYKVSAYDNEQGAPLIAEDGNGGAIAAWAAISLATFFDYDVYVAKITSSGGTAWTTQITNIALEDEFVQDVEPDGNGGVYLAYRGGGWPEYDVFAQHVSASGAKLWTASVPLCTEVGKQNNVRIASLGGSGAIFVWEDERAASQGDTVLARDIYAQKLNSAGEVLWAANGIPICTMNADQSSPELAFDGDGHLFVVWEDFRSAELDLYIQKMDFDGQMLFAQNGLAFCSAAYDQSTAHILADGQGGALIFWDDFRAAPNSDIFGVHLDNDGALLSGWNINGSPISAYFNKQNEAALSQDYASGAVTVWQDKRSSGKDEVVNLYAQRANEFYYGIGSSNDPAQPLAGFRLERPFPNPFNPAVRLRFQLERAGNVRLAIYDLMGRQVALLKDGWQPAGSSDAIWDAETAASGMYIARLEFAGRRTETKILRLK